MGNGGEKDRLAGASVDGRTCADGVGAGERLDMGGDKDRWAGASVDNYVGARPGLEMGGEKDRWAGASMDTRTRADGVGARETVGNGWGAGPVGRSERGCADVCGRCGCKVKGWKSVGIRTGGQERAWMRGRVRTVWVQGKRLEMGKEKDWWAGASVECADVCGRCGCKVKGWEICGETDRWA